MKRWLLLAICLFPLTAAAIPAPAHEVFQLSVQQTKPDSFVLHWQIKAGYFLYADRIRLTEDKQNNTEIHILRFPETEQKTDRQGKKFPIYRNQLSLPIAVLSDSAGETLAQIHYQGCSNEGFCYPPATEAITLSFNDQQELYAATLSPVETTTLPEIEPDNLSKEDALFHYHWLLTCLGFFGLGLLLAFTPCVLPMIPILSGIIVGQGNKLSTGKAFLLSLSYVLSMAFTYALIGAIAAHLGSNLQLLMQAPWAITLFSLVFVLLALSMFGFYDLRLPLSWQNQLARVTRHQSGGHYLGAAVMGSLSILILSPCVTPPLIAALGYITQTGHLLSGSLALFCLGLGMGTPLLLIGTSAATLLPKAGSWMNSVKAFFGFLLLGLAIYLLARILPGWLSMILWGSLLIFSGVYAFSFHPKSLFLRGLGIILSVYGILILIGASLGNENPLIPLQSAEQRIAGPQYEPVKNLSELQNKLSTVQGHPIMMDIYADWCNSCKLMEATTFKEPELLQALADFTLLKADVTAYDLEDKELLKHYQIIAPPAFLFFDRDGKELRQFRIAGDASAATFLSTIQNYRRWLENKIEKR